MYCTNCGKENEQCSQFCVECGAKLVAVEETQTIQQESPKSGMVFCTNCGCEIPSDSRFCPECRAEQNNVEPSNAYLQNKPECSQSSMTNILPDEAKRKKRNKIIGFTYLSALAFCFILIVLSILIKPTINLNKYITISFEGYEESGYAVASFDYEKFAEDYGEKLSKSDKSADEYAYFWETENSNYYTAVEFLEDCANGSFEDNKGLSNGDVVTYTWNCNDKLALSKYGYKLKYKDFEITVEGLESYNYGW